MLSGPRCPVAPGRTFEVAENQEWPANPRSRTGCAARARCTFTPRRHVLGRANIWGSVVSTPTNRLASSILKENPLRKSRDYCAFQTDADWDGGSEHLGGPFQP